MLMKKNSMYEIDGNLYEFSNDKFKKIIKAQNPNRGACEQFYRKVVGLNVGISYDTVKGWVKNNTNPAIEDVKIIAEVLEIPYMNLLSCTHYGAEIVKTRIQKINFAEVYNPFALKYYGFSNVLDMIIGMGYNAKTGETMDADFTERIISIIGLEKMEDYALPELLGYKFKYSDDELSRMSEKDFKEALHCGYVDDDGNSFYDENYSIAIDKKQFGERLLENVTWLDDEDYERLKEIISEASEWWELCDMPFALLKIDINACGHQLASYTYGPGWAEPTHKDRWKLILDILMLLGMKLEMLGLCWMREMHVDQFESEMFLTIDVFGNY